MSDLQRQVSEKAASRDRDGLVALALLAVLFYLPYFIPQSPVASDSYLFGYNNRAAVVLLILFSAAMAIWRNGYNLKLEAAGQPSKVPARVLAGCLAIQAVACVTMILVAGDFGGFGESTYGIDRIYLLAHGSAPYAGFEWPFGVLPLYAPVWTFGLLHCSLANAYYAVWIVASLGGVALLFATINLLDYPTSRKTSIFLMLFVCFLPSVVGMGIHYTLIRYVAPLYFILTVYRVGVQTSMYRRTVLLAVGFTAALLLFSPEMAVAHGFACCVLLFPRKSAISPCALPARAYVLMLGAFAALFGAAYKLHLLNTLLASGGGADSFPIPVSAPVLFFFAVVFVCACAVVVRFSDTSLNDNSIALILLSFPLLAAALGRCDPGHILANGLGLFLAAFLYASRTDAAWRQGRNWFVFAVMLLPSYTFFRYLIPLVGQAATQTASTVTMPGTTGARAAIARFAIGHFPDGNSKRAWMAELNQMRAHAVPATIDFASLYPGIGSANLSGVFDAPFGYKPNGFGSYHSSSVDYGYYEALENANTPRAVQQKIDELARHSDRALLLPGGPDLCGAHENLERSLITVLFFSPYLARVSHPTSVHKPLCDYIESHYTLAQAASASNFEYGLWLPSYGDSTAH